MTGAALAYVKTIDLGGKNSLRTEALQLRDILFSMGSLRASREIEAIVK